MRLVGPLVYIPLTRLFALYIIMALISSRPQRIMLKFLPIMLLSSAQVTHYAQYYTHNYFNYATIPLQVLLFLMSTLVYIVHFIITANFNSSICNSIGAQGMLRCNIAMCHLAMYQESQGKMLIFTCPHGLPSKYRLVCDERIVNGFLLWRVVTVHRIHTLY